VEYAWGGWPSPRYHATHEYHLNHLNHLESLRLWHFIIGPHSILSRWGEGGRGLDEVRNVGELRDEGGFGFFFPGFGVLDQPGTETETERLV